MKLGLPVTLIALAIVGSGVVFTSMTSLAEQTTASSDKRGFEFSATDRAAFFDAKIAALHAGLKLNPEQEKLWPAVDTALHNAFKNTVERFEKTKNALHSENLVDRLRARGEAAVARGENLEALADASSPLYATLTEDQKHRLPFLLRQFRPHGFHHHFAFYDRHDGDEGEHHGWGHEGDHPAPTDR
ncbi:MAG TPA: Spy/CpxP family protein refolding chaperone [Methylocella sp.]|nr:Spy/CpxP family protein refolding chaperone [Methylocella sp.]